MTVTEPPDARARLKSALHAPDASAHLTLAWRPTPPQYKVELVELDESVSATFLRYARTASDQLTARSELAYDPEWPLRDHEYFELTSSELPGGNLFAALADFHNLHTFKKKRLTKPRQYIVAVQTPTGPAFLGKRMAFLKVPKQKTGVFAAVWDGSVFNELTDSVATFSTDFDWIFWDDTLYVLNASGFHAEFRDGVALMRAVANHVSQIGQTLTIQNAAELTRRCQTSVPMASKVRRIAERGLHLTSTITELKAYANMYGIKVQWDGDQLVFDGSLENQWAILKLLDEDRTEGPISHRHYESAAKREV